MTTYTAAQLLDMITDGSIDDLENLADDYDEVGARLDSLTDNFYDEVMNPAPADVIDAVRDEATMRLADDPYDEADARPERHRHDY